MAKPTCDMCGKKLLEPVGYATGYAETRDGHGICYDCCAIQDKEELIESGSSKRLSLYLSVDPFSERVTKYGWKVCVTNWPGTLVFRVRHSSRGRHNIAGTRTNVWFAGPDGHLWWGVNYGKSTGVVHCRRTKEIA